MSRSTRSAISTISSSVNPTPPASGPGVGSVRSSRSRVGGGAWTNRPNAVSANGLYHTNSQGFRGIRDYSSDVPAERVRVVAYGDSYTQSDDVDEDGTWESQLEKRLPQRL